jgi:hypothetical protein
LSKITVLKDHSWNIRAIQGNCIISLRNRVGFMISKQIFLKAILVSLLFCPPFLSSQAVENQNQCIRCHTNLKKLIRLCWEVEKIKPKSKGSAETSGEG